MVIDLPFCLVGDRSDKMLPLRPGLWATWNGDEGSLLEMLSDCVIKLCSELDCVMDSDLRGGRFLGGRGGGSSLGNVDISGSDVERESDL